MVAVPSIGRAAQPTPQHGAPEADATRRLYEQYARQIYAYCFHQLRSREEAEDATQSTFLNAFRGLKRGIDPEFESAWLYKIAQNVCMTRQRSSTRRRRIESPGDLDAIQDVLPAREVDSDDLIGLPEALEGMPEQQRRALLLREWQGLSYKEIAEELGLSQSAVETLLFRARRTLASGLADEPRGGLARRIQKGGDAGSLLALLKSLVVTGGAKVAATVATVAATSVVAATPGARHAVADVVAFQPPPKPGATHPVSAPVVPAAAPAAAVSAPSSLSVHVPAAAAPTPAATPTASRRHRVATHQHPAAALAPVAFTQPHRKADPSDPAGPAAVAPVVPAAPPAAPPAVVPVAPGPAPAPVAPAPAAPAAKEKDKQKSGGSGHAAPTTVAPAPAAPAPVVPQAAAPPAAPAPALPAQANGNGGGKDHAKDNDEVKPSQPPAITPAAMTAAPIVTAPAPDPAPAPASPAPAAPPAVGKDHGNAKDKGKTPDPAPAPTPPPAAVVTVAAPAPAPTTTAAPAVDAAGATAPSDSSHGNGRDKGDRGSGHGKKG